MGVPAGARPVTACRLELSSPAAGSTSVQPRCSGACSCQLSKRRFQDAGDQRAAVLPCSRCSWASCAARDVRSVITTSCEVAGQLVWSVDDCAVGVGCRPASQEIYRINVKLLRSRGADRRLGLQLPCCCRRTIIYRIPTGGMQIYMQVCLTHRCCPWRCRRGCPAAVTTGRQVRSIAEAAAGRPATTLKGSCTEALNGSLKAGCRLAAACSH